MAEKASYVGAVPSASLDDVVAGDKSFEEAMAEMVWPTGWDFRPYQHWVELFSWSGYNWKNFTLIAFEVEYANAMRPSGYFEIHVGLLGVGVHITRWSGASATTPDQPISSVPRED